MGVGAAALLTIGAGVWLMTGEFSGFSFFSITISAIILVSVIRSIGLVLILTPQSISQRSLLKRWDVTSQELSSWELVRNTFDRGYEKIVVRSERGERRVSDWIVTGNRRYHLVLDWLRGHHGSKEVGRGSPVIATVTRLAGKAELPTNAPGPREVPKSD